MVSSAHVVADFIFVIRGSDHSLFVFVDFKVDIVGLEIANDIEIVCLISIVLSI